MRFEGKSVVVTGASSGMGYKIAMDLAKEGATVIAVARRKERLEQLAAVAECGKIDVLVNNAGIMDEFKPISEVEDEQWARIMDVNLTGPMYAMRKAVQEMLKTGGGNIVNIASIGGVNGCRAGAAYTASKHAMVGLTKNTAFMYVDKGIRCNVICPGGIETEVMNSQTNISQAGVARVMAGLDTSIPSGKVEDISNPCWLYMGNNTTFLMPN